MITIYGSPQSSSGRCFWCLEEIAATYETKPINFREKEHKSAAFLEINPHGKVPALVDGDFKIWESMAINFYLTEKYKPELLGKDLQEKALVRQWSFWAIADLQDPMIQIFIQLAFVPEERRDAKLIEKAQAKLPDMFNALDSELKGRDYLVGSEFSLADLNVASVVILCDHIKYDLSQYKNLSSWLGRVKDRPAFQKYSELCQ